MTQLTPCPICSVLPPGALVAGSARNHFPRPTVYRGRRSGRHFFASICRHGPALPESAATEAELAEPWNAWAAEVARAEAERRGFTGERLEWWLYHLGLKEQREAHNS